MNITSNESRKTCETLWGDAPLHPSSGWSGAEKKGCRSGDNVAAGSNSEPAATPSGKQIRDRGPRLDRVFARLAAAAAAGACVRVQRDGFQVRQGSGLHGVGVWEVPR